MLSLRHAPKAPTTAHPNASPTTADPVPVIEPTRRRRRRTPSPEAAPPRSSPSDPPSVIHLPPVVRDLLTHTAAANSRYAVRGVLVERKAGQLNLAATDGHRLAWIRQPADQRDEGLDVSLILPIDALKTLRLSRTHPASLRLTAEPNGKTWLLAAADQLVRITPDEGNFPPYVDVVPPEASAPNDTKPGDQRSTQRFPERPFPAHVWVNPAYLADAATLAQRFTQHATDGSRSVRWQQPTQANRPIRLDAYAGHAKLTVVVMPTSGPRPS